jgi:hypothetical protein
MIDRIEVGFMVFITGKVEAAGAVRKLLNQAIRVYVENAGEFDVPFAAVTDVHDGKVMVDPGRVPSAMLTAMGHAHDAEDPRLTG